MLDTNICIYIIKKRPPAVQKRFESLGDVFITVSVITFAELQYGVHKSTARQHNQNILDAFLANVVILPWDKEAGFQYATLRGTLEKAGNVVGNMDLLIAAHALSQGAVLVTHNVREFARIPLLDIEDWASSGKE